MMHESQPEEQRTTPSQDEAMVPPTSDRSVPETPNFGKSVNRFLKDEDGQSMVEFAIILPIFLFLIFGIIQFMLIANVAYMLNYGNFMALRTATVHWEMSTVGIQNGNNSNDDIPSDVMEEANDALKYSLLPVAYFRGDKIFSTYFLMQTAEAHMNLDSTKNWVESYSTYEYPLMIPLAKNVIYALSQGETGGGPTTQEALPYIAEDGPLFGIDLLRVFSAHTLEMTTNSEIPATGEQDQDGGNPHKMLIHRRW